MLSSLRPCVDFEDLSNAVQIDLLIGRQCMLFNSENVNGSKNFSRLKSKKGFNL